MAVTVAAASGACSFNKDGPLPSDNCPSTSTRTGVFAFGGVVHQADTPPPPMAGGTLTVLWGGDGSYAMASIPELDRVAIVRVPTQGDLPPSVREIALDRGSDPGRIIGDGNGRAHVVLRSKGAIATIDPATGHVLATRDVCPAPRGIVWQHETDSLFVACATGELVTLPAAGGPATRRVFVDRDLRDVVLLGNRILVSRFKSAEVLSLDESGAILQRTVLPTSLKRVPHVAWRMTQAKSKVVVVYELASEAPIDIRRRTAPVQYYNGGAGSTSGAPVVAAVATSTDGTNFTFANDPSVGLAAPAFDVAVSDEGTVVTSGRLQALGLDVARIDVSAVQKSSQGGAVGFPYTTSVEALQVQAMAFGGSGANGGPLLFVQTRTPSAIQVFDPSRPTNEPYNPKARPTWMLPLSGVSDTGFDLFHTQTSSAVACASCHPEGGDDGHVWHFIAEDIGRRDAKACMVPGTGIAAPANSRRTQSLRGGILQTAPFHWDGDMPTVGDIMTNVFTNGMNGGEVTPAQSSVVARWINAIPRLPTRTDLDAARVQSGRALFEGKGACAGCHSGSMLTNNTTVNVGTGDALQVPDLVNIGARAPFLHDGCAKTLADRFNPACGGEKHGGDLTSSEQADVVTYLESL